MPVIMNLLNFDRILLIEAKWFMIKVKYPSEYYYKLKYITHGDQQYNSYAMHLYDNVTLKKHLIII